MRIAKSSNQLNAIQSGRNGKRAMPCAEMEIVRDDEFASGNWRKTAPPAKRKMSSEMMLNAVRTHLSPVKIFIFLDVFFIL